MANNQSKSYIPGCLEDAKERFEHVRGFRGEQALETEKVIVPYPWRTNYEECEEYVKALEKCINSNPKYAELKIIRPHGYSPSFWIVHKTFKQDDKK